MNVVLILVIAAVVWFLSVGRTSTRLLFQFDLPRQIRLENGRIAFVQQVRINNPTPNALTIQGIDLDFLYQNTTVGRANLNTQITLRPGDTVLTLNSFLLVSDVLRLIPVAVRQAFTGVRFDVRGVVRAYGFNLPVVDNVVLQLPKLF